jgi:hypothetical protein
VKTILLCLGGGVFGLLLSVAGVNFTMPSFYPLMLQYAVAQAFAMRAFS